MLARELPLALVRLVFCPEFGDADDAGYAGCEGWREGGMGDQVFVGALLVGGYEADAEGGGCVEGVGEGAVCVTWLVWGGCVGSE